MTATFRALATSIFSSPDFSIYCQCFQRRIWSGVHNARAPGIPGDFVTWPLIFVGLQCGHCFVSPFWSPEFWDGSYITILLTTTMIMIRTNSCEGEWGETAKKIIKNKIQHSPSSCTSFRRDWRLLWTPSVKNVPRSSRLLNPDRVIQISDNRCRTSSYIRRASARVCIPHYFPQKVRLSCPIPHYEGKSGE